MQKTKRKENAENESPDDLFLSLGVWDDREERKMVRKMGGGEGWER